MGEEKLLTVRDVSIILDISEREVVDLAESGTIPAYKVGGVYLRFKREQVMDYKKTKRPLPSKDDAVQGHPLKEKISDFFYFNDFYILTGLLIILLLLVIFQGY
jgi:excisionase family DNA binding protein